MIISTLADLEELLRLCHKQGVHCIKVGEVEVSLTPQDPDVVVSKPELDVLCDPLTGIPLTDDEILFYNGIMSDRKK